MPVKLPFNKALDFSYGVVSRLSPLVRRVIANNPSPYTLFGTGTYLVGDKQVAVIDPGPADVAHMTAVHTPGHAANHLSFYLPQEDALFCGDVVMGWSTTIVAPPDGNMTDYMRTLALLLERSERTYYPTHGAPIDNPQPYVRVLREHRIERENQVLDCIQSGTDRPVDMLGTIYRSLDPSLHGAAMQSLLATVLHLHTEGRILCDHLTPAAQSQFRL